MVFSKINKTQKIIIGIVIGGPILLSIAILTGCLSGSGDAKEPSTRINLIHTPSQTTAVITKTTPSPRETAIYNVRGTMTAQTEIDLENRNLTENAFTLTPITTSTQTQTPLPNGYILFEEDFESGVEGLKLDYIKPLWETQVDENGNHYLCNVDQTRQVLFISFGDEHWRNYQLEFNVKDTEFTYIESEILAIFMRKNGFSKYSFLVYFVGYQNSTMLFSTEVSHVDFSKTLENKDVIPIFLETLEEAVENQWYTVSIKVDEGDISFYWNKKLLLNYRDENYLLEGSIRLNTNYGTCLDNIRVTNIENPNR